MHVPSLTIEFLEELKRLYPDLYEVDPKIVGTPDYWMYAGVIDLIRKIETHTKPTTFKEV